jgi:hypothetical protein
VELRSSPLAAPAVAKGRWTRFAAYLHRHPILALAILTPGIPEYLLGSSTLTTLILPPIFLLFLAANVGLYTTGALLIREAMVRWKKGWATVVALGAAYAIAEEGIGTATMFNPSSSAVSSLGIYGHWLGVNWVFAFGIVAYHVVFSIALPIALLGVALPETRGRSLLNVRQVRVVAGILLADVVVLSGLLQLVQRYTIGEFRLAGCVLAIGGLILLARRLPRDLFAPPTDRPIARCRTMFLLGLSFFPAFLLAEYGSAAFHFPAVAAIGELGLLAGLLGLTVSRWIGRGDNDRHLIALAAGLLVPIGAFGALLTFPYEIILVVDVLAGIGLWHLWKRPTPPTQLRRGPAPPEGAVGAIVASPGPWGS